jgi:hypothetical protein
MQSRGARSIRGLLAGFWATGTAAASHLLAGGTVPPLAIMALALAFAGLVSIALTGARLNAIRLASAVALSQLAYHAAFSALSGGAVSTSPGGAHNHGPLSFSLSTSGTHHDHGGVAMLALHGIAGLVTFAAFLYAERAFWGVRTAAVSVVDSLIHPLLDAQTLAPARRAPSPIQAPRRISPHTSAFVRTHGRRGPPMALGYA